MCPLIALDSHSVLDVINDALRPLTASTMCTAVKSAVRLDPVTNHLAPTMGANRCQLLNSAFKAVEHVPGSCGKDLEREVIVVAAHFAHRHKRLLKGISPPQ